jgi:hypothetical protein
MNYHQRKEAAVKAIRESVSKSILRSSTYTEMWISIDAGSEIGEIFSGYFKKQFPEYITGAIEKTLYGIGYQINNLLAALKTTDCIKLNKIVDAYIVEVFKDMTNWGYELFDSMPEELQNGDEDNPAEE